MALLLPGGHLTNLAAWCVAVAGRFRLLLRPLAAPGRSATSSARWCSTTHAGLGSFGRWHGATAERPAALAATLPASWSGRHPAVGCAGFGGGGDGCFFRCFCLLTGVCGRCWALIWLRQVGRLLWASRDGLDCCWWARGRSAWCAPCAPPAPASSRFLTRFVWLCCRCVGCRRAGTTLTGAAVVCVYGLAWTSAATAFSVLERPVAATSVRRVVSGRRARRRSLLAASWRCAVVCACGQAAGGQKRGP